MVHVICNNHEQFTSNFLLLRHSTFLCVTKLMGICKFVCLILNSVCGESDTCKSLGLGINEELDCWDKCEKDKQSKLLVGKPKSLCTEYISKTATIG